MTDAYFIEKQVLPEEFSYPEEYKYIVDLGITDLGIWNFIEAERAKEIFLQMKEKYPKKSYIPFAEQRGSDDIACWIIDEDHKIYIIENHSSNGTEVMAEHQHFWAWFEPSISEMIEFIKDEIKYT